MLGTNIFSFTTEIIIANINPNINDNITDNLFKVYLKNSLLKLFICFPFEIWIENFNYFVL